MDPITMLLISKAISEGSKAIGGALGNRQQKKAAKVKRKETKRETLSGLLDDAMSGSAEFHAHGLNTKARNAKRKTEGMQNTSDLVRGAFNI